MQEVGAARASQHCLKNNTPDSKLGARKRDRPRSHHFGARIEYLGIKPPHAFRAKAVRKLRI
jgi:hypothetical protein